MSEAAFEDLVKKILGTKYDSTMECLRREEIDMDAFVDLDNNTMLQIGKIDTFVYSVNLFYKKSFVLKLSLVPRAMKGHKISNFIFEKFSSRTFQMFPMIVLGVS